MRNYLSTRVVVVSKFTLAREYYTDDENLRSVDSVCDIEKHLRSHESRSLERSEAL